MASCTLDHWVIEAICRGEHGDAFAVLGPHELADGRWCLRAWLPEAIAVEVRGRPASVWRV
ncbi:GlgB N-terminal domain-containing protein [Chitinimonas arctica]|uniref:GlgB N-terminal domain-containing protein n=1 Tax=Chitinimonas arctica TaxID=2594795 RepID=UPI0027E4ABE2|nr:hypothetical protein [Chitinimonas arctica]